AKYIFVRKSVFFGYELKLLISTAGGRLHFITVQGRHLFKETTFTVSTLPRAWPEPRANRMLVMKALRQITSMGRVTAVPGRRDLSLPSPMSHYGVSRLMLFPHMLSVGRVIAVPGVAAFRSNQ